MSVSCRVAVLSDRAAAWPRPGRKLRLGICHTVEACTLHVTHSCITPVVGVVVTRRVFLQCTRFCGSREQWMRWVIPHAATDSKQESIASHGINKRSTYHGHHHVNSRRMCKLVGAPVDINLSSSSTSPLGSIRVQVRTSPACLPR